MDVEADGQTQFQLPAAPATDGSGDLLLRAELNGVTYYAPDSMTVEGTDIEWVSDVPLTQGERVVFWFLPA